jgi:hypothetical protein
MIPSSREYRHRYRLSANEPRHHGRSASVPRDYHGSRSHHNDNVVPLAHSRSLHHKPPSNYSTLSPGHHHHRRHEAVAFPVRQNRSQQSYVPPAHSSSRHHKLSDYSTLSPGHHRHEPVGQSRSHEGYASYPGYDTRYGSVPSSGIYSRHVSRSPR